MLAAEIRVKLILTVWLCKRILWTRLPINTFTQAKHNAAQELIHLSHPLLPPETHLGISAPSEMEPLLPYGGHFGSLAAKYIVSDKLIIR